MSQKAEYYHLKLTRMEFQSIGQVLDNYVMDSAVRTRTLAAVERVIGKILRESIRHQETGGKSYGS